MATKSKAQQKKENITRPPVVVVLGHVDHGKTSLLDYIRKTKVAERETGGITQHVGAYEAEHKGKRITFIDTPGHEAFSAMRSRGAEVADVAILVVAADEGVKPQTVEALEAIKKAGVSFIVALNKIDKPNVDPRRVKEELTKKGVLLEGWGGDIPNIEVSAKTGKGVDELLELVLLVAELAELKADDAMPAECVVIETHRDPQKGVLATILVRQGTLRVGDTVVSGKVFGKARAITDFAGKAVREAGPSKPVQMLGLSDVPDVGDVCRTVASEDEARAVAAAQAQQRAFEQLIATGKPETAIPIILKGDVLGSLEAIVETLKKLANPIVGIKILAAETGEVNEGDVQQAAATGSRIVAFKVKTRLHIVQRAERVAVPVETFEIIYELIDRIKELLEANVPPEVKRTDLGEVRILALFKKEGARQVVGGRVNKGIAQKGSQVELFRSGHFLGNGRLSELQENKIPVDEVGVGHECGMLIDAKDADISVGDIVRVFMEERKPRKLFAK